MTDIYNQHKAAFAQVSAYVVMLDGERVANIAFKFPRDGAGRLYAYVHWLGREMVRGHASGGGYDKRSAACASAAKAAGNWGGSALWPFHFWKALSLDGGTTWDRALEVAGFTILQAV